MNYRHGKAGTPIYKVWSTMKARCYNKKNKAYPRYGGRGIKVCDRWKNSFEKFYEDMGDCPKGLTLERMDNNGDYTPDNCLWATRAIQANNRRTNRRINVFSRDLTMAEWNNRLGGEGHAVAQRIDRLGWSPADAVSRPLRKAAKKQSKVKGVTWFAPKERWIARGTRKGKMFFLGSFKEMEDAIEARKKWEK